MGLLILTPLLLPLGCQKTSEPAAPAAEQADDEVAPEDRSAFRVHMSEHFVKAAAAREAVIRGDLKASVEPLRWLASHTETAAMPEDWVPYLEQMRASAASGAIASDIDAAAASMATLGQACGDCHEAMERKPRATYSPPTIEGPDDLRGHQYASDFLWNAFVENSDEGWAVGAELLAESPLTADPLTPEIEQMTADMHALGNWAQQATGSSDKAEIVGQMLATCASCHSK